MFSGCHGLMKVGSSVSNRVEMLELNIFKRSTNCRCLVFKDGREVKSPLRRPG